jgi:cbb3-type cytochrome oxidase cytochrome c subunit
MIAALLGCNPASSPQASPPTFPAAQPQVEASPPVPPQFAAGRKVFDAHGCARCHTIGGAPMAGGPPRGGPPGGKGMKGGTKGPDLAKVGANPTHTVEWLSQHIRNAKSHKPDSRMPAYEGKIKPEDVKALAEYLASLKG